MKKLTRISFVVSAFSLVLGGFAALTRTSKKAEPLKAGDPAKVFMIGDHDFFNDGMTADEFDGQAMLLDLPEVYQLVLDEFANNGAYSAKLDASAALRMENLDKPVNIALSGDTFLTNGDSTCATNCGILINNVPSVTFLSADDENPGTLMVSAFVTEEATYGLFGYGCDEIIVNNCDVYLNARKAKQTFGLVNFGDLTIEENGYLNAHANNVSTEGGTSSWGGSVFNLRIDSGEAYFYGGNALSTGDSYGLLCGELIMETGIFGAHASSSVSGVADGIYAEKGITVNGGTFEAEGGATTSGQSYGIRTYSSDKKVTFSSQVESFIAVGETKACKYEISPGYAGFGSATTDIYHSDASVIAAQPGTYDYKTLLFRRIICTVNSNSVEYDGLEHQSVSIDVEAPYYGYTIYYKEAGATDWGTTVPKYTDVSETPYEVEILITAPLYLDYNDSIEFSITKADANLTTDPNKVADFAYNGDSHELITAGETDDGTLMYSVNGGEYSTSVPVATNAGTYAVSYKIVGDSNHNDIEPVSLGNVTIAKADVALTAPTKAEDCAFDGTAHTLLNEGSVTGGILKYSVNGGEYSETVPTATNAGTYEVSYKVEGDANHKDIDPVSLGNVVIGKIDVSLTAPTKVADFEADGKSHSLVDEGAVGGGTLMYSVNGGEYSATAPTASAAGTYEVSYKVVGDENHNDIAPVSLGTVTVASPVTPGPVTPDPVTPDPVTPEGNEPAKKGIGAGGIVGIVLGSLVLVGLAGFAVFWFVLKKKTFADLVNACKNFFNKIFKKKQ